MSEEKKRIYCTQCGSGNDASSKFCSSCGAKLESRQPEENTEGVFSGYEKITDAEEVKPAINPYQEEIKINYSSDDRCYSGGSYSNAYYDTQQASYYSADPEAEKGGGNIGFAIASLVCGIISLLCCCLTLFSALLGIAAIVLGVITISNKYDGKAMAIAGIATGGVSLAIVILAIILRSTSFYREMMDEILYELY